MLRTPVRLACLRYTASVRPELGSNSQKKFPRYYACLTAHIIGVPLVPPSGGIIAEFLPHSNCQSARRQQYRHININTSRCVFQYICFIPSQSTTANDTITLRLLLNPHIGISKTLSTIFKTSGDIPLVSLPTTKAIGNL